MSTYKKVYSETTNRSLLDSKKSENIYPASEKEGKKENQNVYINRLKKKNFCEK
jgi:hypothetical protein